MTFTSDRESLAATSVSQAHFGRGSINVEIKHSFQPIGPKGSYALRRGLRQKLKADCTRFVTPREPKEYMVTVTN